MKDESEASMLASEMSACISAHLRNLAQDVDALKACEGGPGDPRAIRITTRLRERQVG